MSIRKGQHLHPKAPAWFRGRLFWAGYASGLDARAPRGGTAGQLTTTPTPP